MDNKLDYLNINLNSNRDRDNKDNYYKPKLVDKNTKFFLTNVLQNCYKIKNRYYNIYYNLFMLFIFVILLLIILKTKYKGNISRQEIELKQQKNKEYIFSKLMLYNKMDSQNRQSIRNNIITNLPDFNNNPEKIVLDNYNYYQ